MTNAPLLKVVELPPLKSQANALGSAEAGDLFGLFDDTIRRLKAYAAAGADCLYAPGLATRELISAVVTAVAPKPVNILIGTPLPFSVKEIEELGGRRISVGGALARSAWGGFSRMAREIVEKGTFSGFADAMPAADINGTFKR